MHRPTIAALTLVLLSAGAVLLLVGDVDDAQTRSAGGVCLRVGILLGLIWLAQPQLSKLPSWLPLAVVVLALLLAIRPQLFPLVLLTAVVIWFLRPRGAAKRTNP